MRYIKVLAYKMGKWQTSMFNNCPQFKLPQMSSFDLVFLFIYNEVGASVNSNVNKNIHMCSSDKNFSKK
jgi:hypothetical protein